MAVHDWTLVEAGIFHDFHGNWIAQLRNTFNEGLLPSGYYAMSEQHAGHLVADILTLYPESSKTDDGPRSPVDSGGIAVAVAPPRVRRRFTVSAETQAKPRSIAIRHVSGHQLIALVEIVSPSNKDRASSVDSFCTKVTDAIASGVHVLVVDLFPPGPHDPHGLHEVIHQKIANRFVDYDLPPDEPLTLASYVAGYAVEMYVEHTAVGAASVPQMPLFLSQERYVNAPLGETYEAAWKGMPGFWKDVLEGRRRL